MLNRSPVLSSLLIGIAALALFVPFLGEVHLFDWDEINFAECAREMIVTGNYSTVQIDYLPFWEKPPLFIWMQAISMHLFDDPEFAARFPNAVCGAVTLVVIYLLGRRVYDGKFGFLWAMVYAGSLLPNFYFHTGIIDPWFNLFIFLGIYQFVLYANDFPSASTQKLFNRRIVLSALFMAFAVLTKGPVALLVFGLCFLFWRFRQRRPVMSWPHFFLYAAVSLSVAGAWFATLAAQGKGHLVVEFILYQVRLFSTEDAGHGGSFFYHWIVLFAGCFPASVFAIRALFRKAGDTPFELHLLKWMRILFWVVLILFSIVKTKIIHYSSLCYFPLTYLAAYTCYKLLAGAFQWKRWMLIALAFLALVYAGAFTLLPFIDQYKAQLIATGWVKDAFAAGNLEVNAAWKGWEWITGIVFAAGVGLALFAIQRKKFGFALPALFGTVLMTTTCAAVLFAPRVEEYSQHTAIRYWKAHAHPDFYLETLGYKSYAHYFYGNVLPGIEQNPYYANWKKENEKRLFNPKLSFAENQIAMRREWMLRGPIDHPAYFICKNTFRGEVEKYFPQLRFTGEENGFVTWERVP